MCACHNHRSNSIVCQVFLLINLTLSRFYAPTHNVTSLALESSTRSHCADPENCPWPPTATGTGSSPLHPSALPGASPRSEHGILGKRRVKLRSPAVGRTPRGCQPDEQIRPRLSGTLWSAAVRVRGSRAQRRGRWTTQLTSPHATEKMGTVVNGTYLMNARPRGVQLCG